MWQEIVVLLIGVSVVFYMAWKVYTLYKKKNPSKPFGCDGCDGCALKDKDCSK